MTGIIIWGSIIPDATKLGVASGVRLESRGVMIQTDFFVKFEEFGNLGHVKSGMDGIGGITETIDGGGDTSEIGVIDSSWA